MDSTIYIQLIFLCVVNIIFTFSGIILNTLVIVSFWRSSQLQKKLCHFMILVLSCFDMVAVVTNYPGILVYIISWLKEDYDLLQQMRIYLHFTSVFFAFSFVALLLMSIERYLGASYPMFHHTSVTSRRLLTLLAIMLIVPTVMYTISRMNLIISATLSLIILLGLFLPLFIFVNLKLFIIAKKVNRERAVSTGIKRTRMNLKNISSALWAVACLLLLYIPASVEIVFAEKSKNAARLSYIWLETSIIMNSTLNSLVFFWKNKILRAEGIKIVKTVKDRLVES